MTKKVPARKRGAQRDPSTNELPGRTRHRAGADLFDRELSWLEFNARVLQEAQNPAHPLLERLRFLAIFSSNIDEFFMIYVPGMRDRFAVQFGQDAVSLEEAHHMRDVRLRLKPLLSAESECFDGLMRQLGSHGIRIRPAGSLAQRYRTALTRYYDTEVYPLLTPLAPGPGNPFPYVSNLSLSLGLYVRNPLTREQRFARLKTPPGPAIPRFVPIPGRPLEFVRIEDLVCENVGSLFPGMQVTGCHAFRVTRDSDVEVSDSTPVNPIEAMEEQLASRRFGEPERLEVERTMPAPMLETLVDGFGLDAKNEVYRSSHPLALSDLTEIADLPIPGLRYPPFVPSIAPQFRTASDVFSVIRRGDVLLHHPYQSFESVSDFLVTAANDPQVLGIKHTLYRTSGDSPIIEALVEAAENRKQVACVVELKARFDEANNIHWARRLERAGVHVVFSPPALKTHCKVTLVVRREDDGLRRYVHVGTGNYNPRTAALYTDLGLLTCREEYGADATELFNFLTGFSARADYHRFIVAPITMRARLLEMIRREVDRHQKSGDGRIVAKMNALVDEQVIRALYDASGAGVSIDLIVRGMCCLRPGVPHMSENIRVMSIVGRFLEHSRVWCFRNGGADQVYIGSADWMPRNLDRRIEVVVPVESEQDRRFILDVVLETMLRDNVQSWDLGADGSYHRRRPADGEPAMEAHRALMDLYTDLRLPAVATA